MSFIGRLCLGMSFVGCVGSIAYGQRGEDLSTTQQTLVTVRGFLYINGRYVSSPYEIRCDTDSVYVNDIDLRKEGIDLTGELRGDRRKKPGDWRRRHLSGRSGWPV